MQNIASTVAATIRTPIRVKTPATFPVDAKNPVGVTILCTDSIGTGGAVGVTVTVVILPVIVIIATEGVGVHVGSTVDAEVSMVDEVVNGTGTAEVVVIF